MENEGVSADGAVQTTALPAGVVAEVRRRQFREQMLATDVSDIEDRLQEDKDRQRVRKMHPETVARLERENPHVEVVGTDVSVPDGVATGGEDDDPYREEIRAVAARTPEVRFTKAHMLRPFNDEELKIIAAALRAGVALYRVADTLHCSIHKIENAIRDVPVLSELAKEKMARRRQQAQEAVDDCVKSRVPAVVMWNAEKILPEIYGNQVNLDNEDDTRLVIGAIPEEDVAAAEAEVASHSNEIPEVEVGAVMESLRDERGAEVAAAGGGVPVSPLSEVPPAPALNPPEGDPRFGRFVPAQELNRVPVMPGDVSLPESGYLDAGGGGFDDFDDGSWI